MDIGFETRERIRAMVYKLMDDYEKQLEEAYLATESEFKLSFVAKIKPQGSGKKITVEMSFDPTKKVKDSIVETIGDQMPLPLKDRYPGSPEPGPETEEHPDEDAQNE